MATKVLTVDDSKTIRMIVKKAFKPYQVDIAEAENGQQGLAAVAERKPDLIILDITMPVMTGIEMLEKLKADPDSKDIPVIMLTAESGKDNVMHIVKMGVKNYMVKPFKGEQLIERVKQVLPLEERQNKEESPVKRYYSDDGGIYMLQLPPKLSRSISMEIEGTLGKKVREMATGGHNKFILDLTRIGEINMAVIKLTIQVIDTCSAAKVHTRIVGSASLKEEFGKFAETSQIPLHESVDQARDSF